MTTKKVILILGGKGGTGKTLFCRTLFHMLRGEGVRTIGIDADRENPEFWDYHQHEAEPVTRIDFLSIEHARRFISLLDEHQPEVALLDMPGASGAATREQFQRFNLFHTLKKQLNGYEVTVVTILNNCFNVIGSLKVMMDAFGEQASYVAVMSEFWAMGNEPFKRWHNSARRKQLLEAGGKELILPKLEIEVFDVLHEKAMPFSKFDELPLGDRVLLGSYLNRSRGNFDAAHELLGLPPLDGRDTNDLVAQEVAAISAQNEAAQKTNKQTNKAKSAA